MKDLNAVTMQIRDFIESFHEENGFPPTMREIADGLKIKSTKTVFDHILKLEHMGYLRKNERNRARGLISTQNRTNVVRIPIIGKITAGIPITAVENHEDTLGFSSEFFKGGELFMLRVSGDSMKNAGILDRDLIVVRKQSTANSGEIVAALLNGDATVKRLYKEKDHVRLCPENEDYAPILAKSVEILGIVVGVIRNEII